MINDYLAKLRRIELDLHTIETATPRNSATVSRGEMSVVDQGSVVISDGGSLTFGDGGSMISEDFDMNAGIGWQVGTERRGSSIIVLNDVPDGDLTVTTSNSYADYLVSPVPQDVPLVLSLGEADMIFVKIFHITSTEGSVSIKGKDVSYFNVVKGGVDKKAYSYMKTFSSDVEITTSFPDLTVSHLSITVNNAA